MAIQYEEVKEHIDGRDTTYEHPAFAAVRLTRRQGAQYMYGSDFQHDTTITLSVHPSQLCRGLSYDRYHQSIQTLIEVSLTEADFASLISSVGIGAGVPGTLQRFDGKQVPQIPRPREQTAEFSKEARTTAQSALNSLDDLIDKIQELKISQKQKEELIGNVEASRRTLKSSLSYVLGQFHEHVDTKIKKAKLEINAYAQQMLIRSGLKKLLGQEARNPITMIEDDSK